MKPPGGVLEPPSGDEKRQPTVWRVHVPKAPGQGPEFSRGGYTIPDAFPTKASAVGWMRQVFTGTYPRGMSPYPVECPSTPHEVHNLYDG